MSTCSPLLAEVSRIHSRKKLLLKQDSYIQTERKEEKTLLACH
jgi:hypothetical protein